MLDILKKYIKENSTSSKDITIDKFYTFAKVFWKVILIWSLQYTVILLLTPKKGQLDFYSLEIVVILQLQFYALITMYS